MSTPRLVNDVPMQRQPGAGALAGAVATLDVNLVEPTIGASLASVREEVDDAHADMGTFHNLNPDEAMRMASGHSARLSHLRVMCMRIEDWKREWKDVRQRELEPTLEELNKQWQIASRLHSVRELDWRMESGER